MYIFELNIFWITIAPTYYGLMYAIWLFSWYFIVKKRAKIKISTFSKEKNAEILENLLLYIFLWVVLWWRLWYVLFYNLWTYISSPIDIFRIWDWGMSFHGWVVWVILAMWYFSRKYRFSFLKLSDEITAVLPIWLWLWRIWNYLNWELLWYANYTWFLAIYKDWVEYFPSPLLEALLEGFLLFIILNIIYKYKRFDWQIAAVFLILYWLFRIFVEIFFRTPDENIWYIFWFLTMWSLLSIPMILIWGYFYYKLSLTNNH